MARKKIVTKEVKGLQRCDGFEEAEEDVFEKDNDALRENGLMPENIKRIGNIRELETPPVGKMWTPIELTGKGALECLSKMPGYLGWWPTGPETSFRAYIVLMEVEIHDIFMAEIYKKHSEQYRSYRCPVPGKNGRAIRCPDENSCEHCPYGYDPEERKPWMISLEQYILDGGEVGTGYDPTAGEAISNIEAEHKLKKITKKNPRYVEELSLMERNKKVKDIAPMVGVTKDMVYKDIKKMNQIIVDWEES